MPKAYNPKDKLMFKARQEGFRARSVYKLEELDKKFKIIKPGMKVLDLAAAPGSWLQYTSHKAGPEAIIVGLDLKPIAPISKTVKTFETDITDDAEVDKILSEVGVAEFDVILSDAAPNTSGIKHADHMRSIELSRAIFNVAKKCLNEHGKLVMKVFPGAEFQKFKRELKPYFRQIMETKVRASRDRSSEVYLVCF